ncbi:hypothetical protein BZA05DRAFT_393555 [Tricharina praecox]|uniref:uncharacterized protein n=1 Tax=Tricharina praecox TaxID=43433 RepID=UPI002220D77A|nr:uncharacterized protein BZA05DRAFT_393555 [Tricharina praecox]KAI5854219.1 hypothetical protein BZA05DRAFT_393555 [Tricharina praecox]
MSKFYRLFHVTQPFDVTNRFQTSYVLPPGVLACVRLLICVYIFTTNVYRLVRARVAGDTTQIEQHWSFFTNITYWSMGFYFLFAGFHGLVYSRRGIAPLQTWPRILQLFHGVLWTTMCSYSLVVTIVYWGLLADASSFANTYTSWSNISVHMMNTGFSLFEIFISRVERPPWIHLVFNVLFLACYLGLAYVTHATQNFYTYDFLDPTNGAGSLVGYIFGIFVASCVLFLVVWLLVWFREWFSTRVLRLEGKLARNHMAGERVNYKEGTRMTENMA